MWYAYQDFRNSQLGDRGKCWSKQLGNGYIVSIDHEGIEIFGTVGQIVRI